MKITHTNLKQGEVKVKLENPDDLWYLSQVIEPEDTIKGKTSRKIKTGNSKSDESSSSEKKILFLSISVEKIEFHEYSGQLRISGPVNEGTEDVPNGSYHTFSIEEGSAITITKKQWPKFQLDRLHEASESKPLKIMICIFDREDVIFALMKKYGYEIVSEFSGNVEKKADGATLKKAGSIGSFYSDIIQQLDDYDKRYSLDSIIIASPAFWKEELLKEMKNDILRKKMHTATCSSVTPNAVDEVLKRQEVQQVLKQDRIAKESNAVESFMLEISKQGLAAYGSSEIKNAIDSGAVENLLVTDFLIQSSRLDGRYKTVEKLMKKAESMQGKITIISSSHEAGKKLDGLGGMGAILRYKMSY